MTKYLLQRPIAVGMTFLALMVFSVLAYLQLPISLLPDIDVPQLAVRVNYANTSAEAIENNVMQALRQSMATMESLEGMESISSNESGLLKLSFAYGSRMDLAYVEANEKVDQLMDRFPKNMPRPQVIRLNTADIPMVRLHIIPQEETGMLAATELTENVLKKRIEQIEGVSLVDLNGGVQQEISILPNQQLLRNYGLTEDQLMQSIRAANQTLGGIEVKDGQYQYFMRMENSLGNINNLRELPIAVGKNQETYIPLYKLAKVERVLAKQNGYHIYNGRQSLVLNIHKQHAADMTQLMPQIDNLMSIFRADYPQIQFASSQDQSIFLTAGINNLLGSLFFGGLFAFAVLFLFMGSVRLPFIMGISLPASLIISFLFFSLLELSINIISLSGLALGLGMLIDNAIIVLENINRKRAEGISLLQACSEGVAEVRGALISSVLTTLAVFLPLIFLSGISGVLFYDQAVSVAIILIVSLGVSFLLLPLLYKVFFTHATKISSPDSRIFSYLLNAFKRSHHFIFEKPVLFLMLVALLLPLGYFLGNSLAVRGMPAIERSDLQLNINWQSPISVAQNKDRILELATEIGGEASTMEADLGLSDYLLQQSGNSLQQARVYIDFKNEEEKADFTHQLESRLSTKYPEASWEIEEAPNAFDLLFKQDKAVLSLKWRNNSPDENVEELLSSLPEEGYERGESLQKERNVVIKLRQNIALRYNISPEQLMEKLERLFRPFEITSLNSFNKNTPIMLVSASKEDMQAIVQNSQVASRSGEYYDLANLIEIGYEQHYKQIHADASGPYFHLNFKGPTHVEEQLITLKEFIRENRLVADLEGSYFQDRARLQEILYVLFISVILLYFILAAQFESFWQPLLVLLTLPFGICGALIFLWIGNASLNVMSGIGMVVMLGIMVNDAILKIDTMNRELKGSQKRDELYEAVLFAGSLRLKPILMTSITTLLALCPVLILGGLGAELQKPLVLSVMGGLTVGTGTALYLVPLMYFKIKKRGLH